jgi:hypothetical protein
MKLRCVLAMVGGAKAAWGAGERVGVELRDEDDRRKKRQDEILL